MIFWYLYGNLLLFIHFLQNSSCKPKPVSSNKKVDPAAIRRLKLKKEEDERRKGEYSHQQLCFILYFLT